MDVAGRADERDARMGGGMPKEWRPGMRNRWILQQEERVRYMQRSMGVGFKVDLTVHYCRMLVERSPWADSYRGVLLSMLTIRIFLLVLEEYCDMIPSAMVRELFAILKVYS